MSIFTIIQLMPLVGALAFALIVYTSSRRPKHIMTPAQKRYYEGRAAREAEERDFRQRAGWYVVRTRDQQGTVAHIVHIF